ncbi:MAG: alkylhydroperoxidase family enzyme [Limisphaerales bacterium]
MRFNSARAAGLAEEKVELIDDGYEDKLAPHEVAALKLTDDIVGIPGQLDNADAKLLKQHFNTAELAELGLSVGLFMGMSKVLITLGLEPKEMPITLIATPGSR